MEPVEKLGTIWCGSQRERCEVTQLSETYYRAICMKNPVLICSNSFSLSKM